MQSNNKEIYEMTSERTGLPEDLYKELGEHVFESLYSHLRRPKSLITKLKGVGAWHLRKRRMEIFLEVFPPDFDKKLEDFSHPLQIVQYENKVELYNNFKERMIEYDKFLEERDAIREIRFKTQTIATPKIEE